MGHPEPFRIRSVERIHLIPREERVAALERAGYNVFRLASHDVFIDLLTDSGTGAMSDHQWASLHDADESYAGSESFARFADAVREITGMQEVIPAHQGRAAERILCDVLLRPGDAVVSNGLFDTTRANIERVGAVGIDLPMAAALAPEDPEPLKGGIDLAALSRTLAERAVKALVMTCTSNTFGGHPVSLENLRRTAELCRAKGTLVFIDAARFAENAGMLIRRDPSCRGRTAWSVAKEMFTHADGVLMSAKKNGLAHIGGFLALRDKGLADSLRNNLTITEGFETYGGLAGRDLAAIAVGLHEALDEEMLNHRIQQVEDLHDQLRAAGVPVMTPPGGHAVYLDAGRLFPHIPAAQFPGHALACALYAEGGVRGCEIGSLMFPDREAGPELTRLAVPWRTYTAAHLTHVAEALARIRERASTVPGMRIVSAPPALRHFRAVLRPL